MAKSDKSDLFGLKRTLKKASNQNRGMRFLAVYIGLAIMVSFLALASLAPQLGEKLGMLSAKKQSQESEAASTTTLKKYPKTEADCKGRDTSQATTPYKRKNGCLITFQAAKASAPNDKAERIEAIRGDQFILSWNAPDYNGWINPYTKDVKQIVINGIPQADWDKKCEIRVTSGQTYPELRGTDGKFRAFENSGQITLTASQPTVFRLHCRTADKHGNTAFGYSEVKVTTTGVTLQAPTSLQTSNANCSSNNPTVTFKWSPITNASNYFVEVSDDPNFKTKASKETGSGMNGRIATWSSSLPFTGDAEVNPPGILNTTPHGGKTYYWRVTAVRYTGNNRSTSPVAYPTPRSFSIPNCQ